MVKRGSKPEPVALHLVRGTYRPDKHGPVDQPKRKAGRPAKPFGKPIMPQHFKGHRKWAWDRYIKPAWWLDASREPLAIAFCQLWEEFRNAPESFSIGKHGQMRAYLSELGITDDRNRSQSGKEYEDDEFFDD